MTRFASEPHRRHVGGVTWTRDDLGAYSTKAGDAVFRLHPVRSGRSGPVSYDLWINEKSVGGSWPHRGLTRCFARANEHVRNERRAHDPALQSPDVKYPEHEKTSRVTSESQKLGEFLDWLGTQWIFLATPDPRANRFGGHVLITDDHEKLLARYFQIDLTKLEQEKRAMLAALRKVNGA